MPWRDTLRRALADGSRTVDLRKKNIGDAGAKDLSNMLQRNETVTTMDLRCNGIGAAGAKYLSEMLKHNKTLTTMNLSSNGIGNAGAKDLSNMLEHNKTLTTMDLRFLNIGDAGAKYLAEIKRLLRQNQQQNTSVVSRSHKEKAAPEQAPAEKKCAQSHAPWSGRRKLLGRTAFHREQDKTEDDDDVGEQNADVSIDSYIRSQAEDPPDAPDAAELLDEPDALDPAPAPAPAVEEDDTAELLTLWESLKEEMKSVQDRPELKRGDKVVKIDVSEDAMQHGQLIAWADVGAVTTEPSDDEVTVKWESTNEAINVSELYVLPKCMYRSASITELRLVREKQNITAESILQEARRSFYSYLSTVSDALKQDKRATYDDFVERIRGSMFADSHGEWQVDLLAEENKKGPPAGLLSRLDLRKDGKIIKLRKAGWKKWNQRDYVRLLNDFRNQNNTSTADGDDDDDLNIVPDNEKNDAPKVNKIKVPTQEKRAARKEVHAQGANDKPKKKAKLKGTNETGAEQGQKRKRKPSREEEQDEEDNQKQEERTVPVRAHQRLVGKKAKLSDQGNVSENKTEQEESEQNEEEQDGPVSLPAELLQTVSELRNQLNPQQRRAFAAALSEQ